MYSALQSTKPVTFALEAARHAWPLLLVLAIINPPAAHAADAARVEAVQVPAWLLRNGASLALRPAMALEAGDVVRTGNDARLLLRLAEGSLVRLGPNAELALQALKPADAPGGLFEGLLDVVKGAFRFTTTLLSKAHRRRLDVRIANVTAGIRGTDVWGKAATDRDIVCLIDGQVSVQRGDDPAITLSQPLTFYVAPRGQPALPVRPVDPQQLQRWAQETDMREYAPALAEDGAWTVHLESLSTAAAAARSQAQLRARGFPVSVHTADVGGKTYHRVSLSGFGTWQGALAFKNGIAAKLGFATAWVAAQ